MNTQSRNTMTKFSNETIVKAIRNLHDQSAKNEVSVMERGLPQLAKDFIVEKNAKNKAYYFIISMG